MLGVIYVILLVRSCEEEGGSTSTKTSNKEF